MRKRYGRAAYSRDSIIRLSAHTSHPPAIQLDSWQNYLVTCKCISEDPTILSREALGSRSGTRAVEGYNTMVGRRTDDNGYSPGTYSLVLSCNSCASSVRTSYISNITLHTPSLGARSFFIPSRPRIPAAGRSNVCV